jgi:hypothetical protein
MSKLDNWVILIALAVTTATVKTYVHYSQKGDLFLDDYFLGNRYKNSLRWEELWNFENFGRFISRNVYWRLGSLVFHDRAQFYYLLNILIIIATAVLLAKFVSRRQSWLVASVIGSIYLVSAATVDEFIWISNSQHLIAHMFIALFLVVSDRINLAATPKSALLVAIFSIGLFTNLIFGVALLWPTLRILHQTPEIRTKEIRNFLIPSAVISLAFLVLFFRVRENVYYSTAIDYQTLELNVDFYFHGWLMFAVWILALSLGLFIGIRRKNLLTIFFSAGSFLLFMPFAFQEFQRYSHYMNMSQLFLAAGWLIVASEVSRLPKVVFCVIATVVLMGFFIQGKEQVHAWEAGPWGPGSRKVIEDMQAIDSKLPSDPLRYCFDVENDQKVMGASATWWSVGLGGGFEWLVDDSDTYKLLGEDSGCDAIVSLGPLGTILTSSNK